MDISPGIWSSDIRGLEGQRFLMGAPISSLATFPLLPPVGEAGLLPRTTIIPPMP